MAVIDIEESSPRWGRAGRGPGSNTAATLVRAVWLAVSFFISGPLRAVASARSAGGCFKLSRRRFDLIRGPEKTHYFFDESWIWFVGMQRRHQAPHFCVQFARENSRKFQ
jgi:hypothetical protein